MMMITVRQSSWHAPWENNARCITAVGDDPLATPSAESPAKKELLQFVRDVEKAVIRHRQAQEHRMRSYMHACRLPAETAALYLQAGLLPRILRDTYKYYHSLLETVRSAQWEMDAPTWKDSYVDQMIRHHSLELGHIRLTATDYRMHLLETYVYLRNAQKEKFQDPSFTRSLLSNLARGSAGGTEAPPAAASSGQETRCKHCRRAGIHSGTSKEDCLLSGLPARKAQSALSGLNKTKAKAVAKAIKEAVSSNPNGDHDDIVSTARAAV